MLVGNGEGVAASEHLHFVLRRYPATAHLLVVIGLARICPVADIIDLGQDEVRGFCGHSTPHLDIDAQRSSVNQVDQDSFDPIAFIAKMGAGKSIQKYRRNESIFSQGDAADSVFYIQRGRVKLIVISSQGKEAIVGILDAGQFFGEGCLSNHPLRMATTVAMEDSVITSIKKHDMMTALRNEPKFSEMFMAYLLNRNTRIEADLIDHLFNSSEKRLARLLLLLANFGKEGNPQPIHLQISQETLAEMIGTTRSRVSFFMNRFRKLGFISYNGKIEVHSSLLHAVLHEKLELSDIPEHGDQSSLER
jgi:CRP/FNR family transcriptional regulator, cyclic AMP receptor protein